MDIQNYNFVSIGLCPVLFSIVSFLIVLLLYRNTFKFTCNHRKFRVRLFHVYLQLVLKGVKTLTIHMIE